MYNRFKNIPVQPRCKILNTLQTTFNGIVCLYQFWQKDTMYGSSIIFYGNDVCEFTDKEIEHWIREFQLLIEKGSIVKVSRDKLSPYVIVSFNFLEI